jgi:hypothetical protein
MWKVVHPGRGLQRCPEVGDDEAVPHDHPGQRDRAGQQPVQRDHDADGQPERGGVGQRRAEHAWQQAGVLDDGRTREPRPSPPARSTIALPIIATARWLAAPRSRQCGAQQRLGTPAPPIAASISAMGWLVVSVSVAPSTEPHEDGRGDRG